MVTAICDDPALRWRDSVVICRATQILENGRHRKVSDAGLAETQPQVRHLWHVLAFVRKPRRRAAL